MKREDLHLDTFLIVQLAHVGMAQVGWFSSCRTSPTKAQCLTYSFYPSPVPPMEFSGVLKQRLEQPFKKMLMCMSFKDFYIKKGLSDNEITSDVSRIRWRAESTRAYTEFLCKI